MLPGNYLTMSRLRTSRIIRKTLLLKLSSSIFDNVISTIINSFLQLILPNKSHIPYTLTATLYDNNNCMLIVKHEY